MVEVVEVVIIVVVIIIIIIMIIIIIIKIIKVKIIITALFHSYLYKIFTIKLLKKKKLIAIFKSLLETLI